MNSERVTERLKSDEVTRRGWIESGRHPKHHAERSERPLCRLLPVQPLAVMARSNFINPGDVLGDSHVRHASS